MSDIPRIQERFLHRLLELERAGLLGQHKHLLLPASYKDTEARMEARMAGFVEWVPAVRRAAHWRLTEAGRALAQAGVTEGRDALAARGAEGE